MNKKPAIRLDARVKYQLTKELEVYASGPRKLTLTTAEFITEVSRDLGCDIPHRQVEISAENLGLRLSDVFKPSTNNGRSLYADLYKLQARVEAMEQILAGLI